MGLFGRGDRGGANPEDGSGIDGVTVLGASRDHLVALALDELATEILGPGTGNEWHRLPIPDVYKAYDPTGSGLFAGLPRELVLEVQFLIEEGLQRLEHDGLVVQGVLGSNHPYPAFHLTRAGRALLDL